MIVVGRTEETLSKNKQKKYINQNNELINELSSIVKCNVEW